MKLLFSSVGIVGVGLIGGSIGLALKRAKPTVPITGIGRDAGRLQKARDMGIIDRSACSPEALRDCDLVILATPIERILELLESLGDSVAPETVITDVGSTKRTICDTAWRNLPATVEFIGGHPVAGREVGGMENSLPGLFEGAAYILCPRPGEESRGLARLKSFTEILGSRCRVMTPEDHDQALAWTSHLPQLVSTALANVTSARRIEVSGSGLRDMLRLAGSPYSVWDGIFETNRDNVAVALEEFIRHLERVRRLLGEGRLKEEFERAGENQRRTRQIE